MTRRRALVAAVACAALVAGCAQRVRAPASAAAAPQVFVLVRHAEKAADSPDDPSLSDAGRARAQRLARSLEDAPVVAVYATGYRRTQLTALPTATAHALAVTTYDARRPAGAFAAELRAAQRRGTVLVVGHSNTVPAIAAALCGCVVAPMREDEYDRRIEVRIAADGAATLEQTRDGVPVAE